MTWSWWQRSLLPCVLVAGAVVVPAAASADCLAPAPPVEAETLSVTFTPVAKARRPGEQIVVRARVGRAFAGRPVSSFTDREPINFATVHAEISSGRTLDWARNETDADGWVQLIFNLPRRTRSGPVSIRADVRYATVGSATCEEPYVVETGSGDHPAIVEVRAR